MTSSKRRIAAAIKRFPFTIQIAHAVWRVTRPRYSVGVVGVLFNKQGELLIVEHVYHTYPQWGLPGGYMDRGENPHDAVAREMHEELGMRVTVGKPLLIERAIRGHLDFAYLCYSDDPVNELSSELLDYRWVYPDQLPELRKFQRKAIAEALVLLDEKV